MRRTQKIVTSPSVTPISLAEAKKQAKVYHDLDDDEITRMISSSTSIVEQYLQRKLITQTWKMYLDSWPSEIELLFGDLQSVTHVKYTDSDESQSTFDSAKYLVDTDNVPGRIVLKTNETWPTDTLSPKNPIEIQFVTGYGDTSASVPADIRNAILWLTSYLYNYRESVVLNNKMNIEELPFNWKSMLYPHRIWGLIL
jgi:uncharacterized phiE125 gp8 family phage protein